MGQKGFTLIELLVAVAIIGILAAAAIPQYRMFLIRVGRTEAVAVLTSVHKAQMAHFAARDQFYPENSFSTTCASAGMGTYNTEPSIRSINQYLGLGDYYYSKEGYVFKDLNSSMLFGYRLYATLVNGVLLPSSGFAAALSKDLDRKAGEPFAIANDSIVVKQNAHPCYYPSGPNGIAFLAVDDLDF